MVCSSRTFSLWFDMGYSWWFLVYSWWRYGWSSWWPQLGAYRLEITYRIWFDLDLGWLDLILFDLVKFGWVVFILICYGCVKVIMDIRWWWWFKRKCERVMLTSTFRVLVNDNAWMISGLKLSSTLPRVANKSWKQRQIKGDRWRPAKNPPMTKLVSLWLTLKEKFTEVLNGSPCS